MKSFFILLLFAITLPAAEELTSPSEIYAAKTAAETPTGPEIFGVFRGRTPCQDLSAQLNATASDACNKVKCRLFLYQDPVTKAPTTYEWIGKTKWKGNWTITKGSKTDPEAIIYKLTPPDPKAFLSLLKADDNILYLIDSEGKPLVGNIHFSYTLNRTNKKKLLQTGPFPKITEKHFMGLRS